MTTPHRGLPPPAAMTLHSPPSQGSSSSLGQLPQPWQGSEESLRTWLQTKMEEERRRAEEERTRQEQYRGDTRRVELDTRRVELEMLRESFKHGVPPSLVPLMFIGPGVVRSSSGEWVQEYIAQHLSVPQQQLAQLPQHAIQAVPPASPSQTPSLRRETRSIHQMHPQPVTPAPGPAQPPPHPAQQMGPPGSAGSASAGPSQPPQGYVASYQLPGTGVLTRPSSQAQPPMQAHPQPASSRSGLPRINTGELQIQQVHPNVPMSMGPPQPGPPGPPPPSESRPPHQQETAPVTQSPSIFFHHWVPPNTQSGGGGGGGAPPSTTQVTTSPQRQLDSPFSHNPPTNALSGPEYGSSPKKRKSMASQTQQPPPPSSQPFSPRTQSSPPATVTPIRTRRGHSRNRSDTHSGSIVRGFEPYTRPTTRQRKSLGTGDSQPPGEQQPHYQHPMASSSGGDSGGSAGHSGSGTPSQLPQEQHRRQQSAPPPQHSQPPSRPYSAGSDFRREPYPPPPEPSKDSQRGDGGRT